MSPSDGLVVVSCPHGKLFPVGVLTKEQLEKEVLSRAFIGQYDKKGVLVIWMNESLARSSLAPFQRKTSWVREVMRPLEFETVGQHRFKGRLSGPKRARKVFLRLIHGLDYGMSPGSASAGACQVLIEESLSIETFLDKLMERR